MYNKFTCHDVTLSDLSNFNYHIRCIYVIPIHTPLTHPFHPPSLRLFLSHFIFQSIYPYSPHPAPSGHPTPIRGVDADKENQQDYKILDYAEVDKWDSARLKEMSH